MEPKLQIDSEKLSRQVGEDIARAVEQGLKSVVERLSECEREAKATLESLAKIRELSDQALALADQIAAVSKAVAAMMRALEKRGIELGELGVGEEGEEPTDEDLQYPGGELNE